MDVPSQDAGPRCQVEVPANVKLGADTVIEGDISFKRFHSRQNPGLVVGAHCTMDHVHFAVGPEGSVRIGDFCYFTCVVLLADLDLRFGDYVVIGWNTTIADTDFHPLEPAERIADAVACSPLGKGKPRPAVARKAVVVGDDVWIGAAVTILKGVNIGSGAYVEPGSLVTRDVPPRARVMGNPARIVGEV
jgi:acetyltransferase-like isoleucine patch superfamily enzyme